MAERRTCGAERAIRLTTTVSVVGLAAIAALVSYKHMFLLVRRYGEESWTAALLPVSVDGMIAASSMSLLLDSRFGRRSGLLPWTLLILGSTASLAANIAVAEPSLVGRLIAGWPSCALSGSYELLMGQISHTAGTAVEVADRKPMRSLDDSSELVRGSEVPHDLVGGASEQAAGATGPLPHEVEEVQRRHRRAVADCRGGRPSWTESIRTRRRCRRCRWISAGR